MNSWALRPKKGLLGAFPARAPIGAHSMPQGLRSSPLPRHRPAGPLSAPVRGTVAHAVRRRRSPGSAAKKQEPFDTEVRGAAPGQAGGRSLGSAGPRRASRRTRSPLVGWAYPTAPTPHTARPSAQLTIIFGLPTLVLLLPFFAQEPAAALLFLPALLILPGPRDLARGLVAQLLAGQSWVQSYMAPPEPRGSRRSGRRSPGGGPPAGGAPPGAWQQEWQQEQEQQRQWRAQQAPQPPPPPPAYSGQQVGGLRYKGLGQALQGLALRAQSVAEAAGRHVQGGLGVPGLTLPVRWRRTEERSPFRLACAVDKLRSRGERQLGPRPYARSRQPTARLRRAPASPGQQPVLPSRAAGLRQRRRQQGGRRVGRRPARPRSGDRGHGRRRRRHQQRAAGAARRAGARGH